MGSVYITIHVLPMAKKAGIGATFFFCGFQAAGYVLLWNSSGDLSAANDTWR